MERIQLTVLIPKPDRADFDSLPRMYVEVFHYLVSQHRHGEKMSVRQAARLCRLDERTVEQAIFALHTAGFIVAPELCGSARRRYLLARQRCQRLPGLTAVWFYDLVATARNWRFHVDEWRASRARRGK